jgi:hypothetical protein
MNTNPRKFFIGVNLHEVGNESYTYFAKSEADCKDSTDKSIFQEVVRHMDCITMGMFVGVPVFET